MSTFCEELGLAEQPRGPASLVIQALLKAKRALELDLLAQDFWRCFPPPAFIHFKPTLVEGQYVPLYGRFYIGLLK